jgi:LmbE family N-acetylglucosaminyl deacetylase
MIIRKTSILFLFFSISVVAQEPSKPSSSEILQQIQALNFLGNVLYVAAHPDDENTSLITFFSKKINAKTTYLSLTRGDGGQNLIGPELGEKLGMIRTQELLNARSIDDGQQMFSRAIDFGYSKTPEETLNFWDKEQILSDVVWAIRKHRPDIIINRFDHRTSGTTHGHHTASAILSVEAFKLAGDKTKFTSQLKHVEPWEPKRAFFNTSWWFYGSQEAFEKADKTNFIELEINKYYPLEGLSNNEISALSRSQHKSQGFGNTGYRGEKSEYIELINGQTFEDKNPFSGIDTSWNRVPEGEAIGEILYNVEKNFDLRKPWASIPELLKAKALIEKIEDDFWRTQKTKQIKDIIVHSLGVFAEARSSSSYGSPGSKIDVRLELINRSPVDILLKSVSYQGQSLDIKPSKLENNLDLILERILTINTEEDFTTPYWLKNEPEPGIFKVTEQKLIGLPETPEPLLFTFELDINGTPFTLQKPLIYKYNDPVKGEVYQNFEILPKASLGFKESVFIFKNSNSKTIEVSVKSFQNNLKGKLRLKTNKGWKISPEAYDVDLENNGQANSYSFEITPTSTGEVELTPELSVDEHIIKENVTTIAYDHIGSHKLITDAKTKLVNLDIKISNKRIAYVEGAGSSVASNLQDLGYEVKVLEPSSISKEILDQFDVVIMGIRAYNIHNELAYKQSLLFQFVEQGGTMIVQYNTNRGLKTDAIAPFEMNMSRDRVTQEDAEVRFINPDHPVLNTPNPIDQKDFEGWVQERGLYFPNKWSDKLSPILSMNDSNESPKEGSLLVGTFGKGHYIYTGLSFFRELPAGVSGAYKLLSNLISIE